MRAVFVNARMVIRYITGIRLLRISIRSVCKKVEPRFVNFHLNSWNAKIVGETGDGFVFGGGKVILREILQTGYSQYFGELREPCLMWVQ